MFCTECGQELPVNPKFCSHCGTVVNNIPTTTPPIIDDVAARAEDVVITDDMPSLDAQGVNDDVLRKASFIGYSETYTIPSNNYITSNDAQSAKIERQYPIVSKKTFFGGELSLVKTEYSENDYSYHFQASNIDSVKYAHIGQTDIQLLFLAKLIGLGKYILLRWDYNTKSIVQDISDNFDSIETFTGNYAKVCDNGRIGYVYYNPDRAILEYAIECKYTRISHKTYFDNLLNVFGINNYFVVCIIGQPKEEYSCFQEVSNGVFKTQLTETSPYKLLTWNTIHKNFLDSLSTHMFQYISDTVSLNYLTVKEDNKYGYVKIESNGHCTLAIPCIFDMANEWITSDPKIFCCNCPIETAKIKYNGQSYIIDPQMRYYAKTNTSRLIKSIIESLPIIVGATIGIGICFMLTNTDLFYSLGGKWKVLLYAIVLIGVYSVITIWRKYNNKSEMYAYIQHDIKLGKNLFSKGMKRIISIFITYALLMSFALSFFLYKTYIFNWKYDYYSDCSEIIAVQKNKKWGFINKLGQEIIPLKYDFVKDFQTNESNIIARVVKDKKWGLIDIDGKVITPLIYDYIGPFVYNMALVNIGGIAKDEVFESTGWAVSWTNGLHRFNDDVYDGKWGYIDTSGKEVIPIIYEKASDFIEHTFQHGITELDIDRIDAEVLLNGKTYYILPNGDVDMNVYDFVTNLFNKISKLSAPGIYYIKSKSKNIKVTIEGHGDYARVFMNDYFGNGHFEKVYDSSGRWHYVYYHKSYNGINEELDEHETLMKNICKNDLIEFRKK